jgi:hypothetical protein
MTTIAQISQTMQTLLTTTTETVAATLHYTKRPDRAKFTPSTLVQTLVFGWLAPPAATVEQLAQMAGRIGVDGSAQAPDQRFSERTSTLLYHVLIASIQHVVAAAPVRIPILQRFSSVRVHDSTTIGLPDALTTMWVGCGNATGRGTAGLKCGIQLDLLTGVLWGLDLADGRAADHSLPVEHAPLGALLGYCSATRRARAVSRPSAFGRHWMSSICSRCCKHKMRLPCWDVEKLTLRFETPRLAGGSGWGRTLFQCPPIA